MSAALEILIGGLLAGSVFALVALGFALVYRVTGAVNLAQGGFVVLGALVMYSLQTNAHWPLVFAFLGSLGISIAVGTVVARFVFAPGLRRLPGSGMVMLTGGLLTLFEGAMLLVWGSQPYQLQPFSDAPPLIVAGAHVPVQGLYDAGATVLIVAVLFIVLQRTTLGKALRACADNPAAASLMGIDVPRMTVVAFVVASAIGAASGMVIGPILSLEYDLGRYFTIMGFVSVAIGGFGSFFGALSGGLGLGVIEQGASGYLSSTFSTTIALGLLFIVLVWRPNGLFISRAAKRDDVREASVHVIGAAGVRLDPMVKRVLGGLGAGAVLLFPLVVHDGGALSSMIITGLIFIAILGLDVLMGYAGQVSLGHAAFMAIGAYGAAVTCTKYGWPPLAGLAIGLVASLFLAAVVSVVTVRLRGHYLALATLAFGLLVDSLAVGLTGFTGGPSGLTGVPNFSIGPWSASTPIANYYLVWIVALVAIVVLGNAMRSDFGRALRAIRTDQTAARALGINVPRYKLYAFLISAGFASAAGSLYAFYFQFLSPEMVSTSQSLAIVTMLVIGGEGTLVGPFFGVIILTLIPTAFQFLATYKTLAAGALLVAALLYFPGGLFGAFLGIVRALTTRRRGAVVPRGAQPT